MRNMDRETKNSLKELMYLVMMLAMFLIFLSYIKEFSQRITRLENITETLMNTRRGVPNYYEYLKGFEPVKYENVEIVPR